MNIQSDLILYMFNTDGFKSIIDFVFIKYAYLFYITRNKEENLKIVIVIFVDYCIDNYAYA